MIGVLSQNSITLLTVMPQNGVVGGSNYGTPTVICKEINNAGNVAQTLSMSTPTAISGVQNYYTVPTPSIADTTVGNQLQFYAYYGSGASRVAAAIDVPRWIITTSGTGNAVPSDLKFWLGAAPGALGPNNTVPAYFPTGNILGNASAYGFTTGGIAVNPTDHRIITIGAVTVAGGNTIDATGLGALIGRAASSDNGAGGLQTVTSVDTNAGTFTTSAPLFASGYTPVAEDFVYFGTSQGSYVQTCGNVLATAGTTVPTGGLATAAQMTTALSRLSGGRITLTSALDASGHLTIVTGDDYSSTNGRPLAFTSAWSVSAPSSCSLRLSTKDTYDATGAAALTVAGTSSLSGGTLTASFSLTAAQTAALAVADPSAASNYWYQVTATVGGTVRTLALGLATVRRGIGS
jgi:hypothetical protein